MGRCVFKSPFKFGKNWINANKRIQLLIAKMIYTSRKPSKKSVFMTSRLNFYREKGIESSGDVPTM